MKNSNLVIPFFSPRLMLDELRPALESALGRVIDSAVKLASEDLFCGMGTTVLPSIVPNAWHHT